MSRMSWRAGEPISGGNLSERTSHAVDKTDGTAVEGALQRLQIDVV